MKININKFCISFDLHYLCSKNQGMFQKKEQKKVSIEEQKEALLIEKARKSVICFNSECPRHEHCLRWQAGRVVTGSQRLAHVVSPHYAPIAQGRCDYYVNDQPLVMPVGMKHFYDDMPQRIQVRIKKELILYSCRATYYKYHSGLRPIHPAMQQLIERVAREAGWQGPFVYDSEITTFDWH